MRERSPRDLRYYLERIGPESAREEMCEKPEKGERNQRVREMRLLPLREEKRKAYSGREKSKERRMNKEILI